MSIAVFFVSIAVNCTRFSEISTMPFIRGNARHAGRPRIRKVKIPARDKGIKSRRQIAVFKRRAMQLLESQGSSICDTDERRLSHNLFGKGNAAARKRKVIIATTTVMLLLL